MKQIYKNGGDWVTSEGVSYTALVINDEEAQELLNDGWVLDLSELKAKPVKKQTRKKGA